jgi:dTDP-4-dehydrorhamnose 3,5-epimerase
VLVTPTAIPEVLIIEPKIFRDERGLFFESFNAKLFEEITGLKAAFVQDNHSESIKNVLRGLHYQKGPYQQGKLVRVIHGEVFDVAVDLRKNQSTFGKWVGVILNDQNCRQLWIPPGFAHGFLTLSQRAVFLYKVTEYYASQFERCIIWNDSEIDVKWPLIDQPILSLKDAQGEKMKDLIHYEI